jgi:hypothetical protein
MGITADRIKDIGPQPQSFDIERATKENTNYRSVAWSGRYLQVTLMSIPAGGDIGLEASGDRSVPAPRCGQRPSADGQLKSWPSTTIMSGFAMACSRSGRVGLSAGKFLR